MGCFGDAVATTFAGEVTVAPSVGFEIDSGKSLEPPASGGAHVEVGGVHAGGAGSGLVLGLQVMGTGGVEGEDGCGEGGGFVTAMLLLPLVPHAHDTRAPSPITSSHKVR